MLFELVSPGGHPVQFLSFFAFFTFLLLLVNCICMAMVFRKKNAREGCPVRLFINSTLIFALHLVISVFGWQYSMWAEPVPSGHVLAQVGTFTWLLVTPLLYFLIATLFVILCIYLAIERKNASTGGAF